MRKFLVIITLLASSPLLSAQQALNNDSVIKLVKAGLSEDLVVSTINASPGTYDTSVDSLIALKTAGVSDKVISAIMLKSSSPAMAAQSAAPGQSPADALANSGPRAQASAAQPGQDPSQQPSAQGAGK